VSYLNQIPLAIALLSPEISLGCENGRLRFGIRFQMSLLPPSSGRWSTNDGGTKHLWNVGQYLPYYTAQHSRRQPFSYSLPWEPEISLSLGCNQQMVCNIRWGLSSLFGGLNEKHFSSLHNLLLVLYHKILKLFVNNICLLFMCSVSTKFITPLLALLVACSVFFIGSMTYMKWSVVFRK
jgi:hypothetical protein